MSSSRRHGGGGGPMSATLQPGTGEIRAAAYLSSTPSTILWGRLPCAADEPVLRVADGAEVTIDTISHEGLLDDQGSDPLAYFTGHGVAAGDVLTDAVEVVGTLTRDPAAGPHLVAGPIHVEGAMPGDLLAITVLETTPRVPYGVISNRHGRGALAGELPRGADAVSLFAPVVDGHGRLPFVQGGERSIAFPIAPFLGIMGVAVAGPQRPHSV